MASINYGQTLTGALTITRTVSRTADGEIVHGPINLPVGKAGTLTLRGNNTDGNITIPSNTLIAGDLADLYFAAGEVRFGAVIGNVSGNICPFSGGLGDALPLVSAALVATKQVQINTYISPGNLTILGLEVGFADRNSAANCHANFQTAAGVSIGNMSLGANTPHIADIQGGAANPLIGAAACSKILVSNGSTGGNGTLQVLGLQDSTS